jgi:hypothetical protein
MIARLRITAPMVKDESERVGGGNLKVWTTCAATV